MITRRQFLKRSTAAAAGIAVGPNIITSAALGQAGRAPASERIVMGVIGTSGRGREVMKAFMVQPDTQVVAVCDCYGDRRKAAQDDVNKQYGNQDCACHLDMFDVLNRPDIDALLIATGDNWHSGVSLLAARAGKDMYCEKPMSVTIAESRAVSNTMRRLGRIFQCGTQRRSLSNFRFAADLAISGKLGATNRVEAVARGRELGLLD